MEFLPTEDLNLIEYKKIVTNIEQEFIFSSFADSNKDESSNHNFQEIHNKRDIKAPMIPKIYSIKDVTKDKTGADIIDLIRSELFIVDDEITIWNKTILAIARFNIDSESQLKGGRI